jgi:hypothetical protein
MLQRRLANVLEHQVWSPPEGHVSLLTGARNGVKSILWGMPLVHLKALWQARPEDPPPLVRAYLYIGVSLHTIPGRSRNQTVSLFINLCSQHLASISAGLHFGRK